jgi:hypothetical protein
MFDDFDTQIHPEDTQEYLDYEDERELERHVALWQNDPLPPVGTYAFTARLMAETLSDPDDPDFWDRWKDEMKDRDLCG